MWLDNEKNPLKSRAPSLLHSLWSKEYGEFGYRHYRGFRVHKKIQIMDAASCIPSLFIYLLGHTLTYFWYRYIQTTQLHHTTEDMSSLQNVSQPLFCTNQNCVDFSKVCNCCCIFHQRDEMWTTVLFRTMVQALLVEKCIKKACQPTQPKQPNKVIKQTKLH